MNTQEVHWIITFLEYAVMLYFGMSVAYVFLFSLAGIGYRRKSQQKTNKLSRIAVFIPAYKEDGVIVEVVRKALQQQYPPSFFDIIVIADSMKAATLNQLRAMPIKVVEVSFEKSTKAKALRAALAAVDTSYDYALVLDADNVMESHFLQKLNKAFSSGSRAIQAHRKAKNTNTSFAILDAISEEINNHIFRKGHSALKVSSGLIGSGMAFEYSLFASLMQSVDAVGGFDKELEFALAAKKIYIEYLEEAVVYDEKIQRVDDFSTQRRRWLSTQFIFLRKYFLVGIKSLFTQGNYTLFDKVWQLMVPPRLLLLGSTLGFTALYTLNDIFGWVASSVSVPVWQFNGLVLICAFALAFPTDFYKRETLKASLSLPMAFFKMLGLLFKLKGANKNFIHTTHGVVNS